MHINVLHTIGNTPFVQLQHVVPPGCANVYIKLEYFNPTGAYKDRMALAIIEAAEQRGDLKKGMAVVECTGGGTGTALALVCSVKGYRFIVVSSDAFAREKLLAMRSFGAELEIVPSKGGVITPDLIPSMIARTQEITSATGAYWTRQFENRDALAGYRVLGGEILNDLQQPVDVFCAAIGTAGMITGVGLALKQANPATRVIGLEPASAPLLSKGIKGSHKVEGIGIGFVPPLLDKAACDYVQAIEEEEARTMARRLAAEEGIFVGTSTGMNVVAAVNAAKELGSGHTVVTVACDSGLKYISAGLFD